MKTKDQESILQAGDITKKVREYVKTIVKKDMSMLELAEKIEAKIIELKGNLAFPVNLSVNEVAAHHTPAWNDEEKTHGLLKVDFGVSINGWTSDTAISFDLDNLEENKKLITAAEEALKSALKIVNKKATLGEIGKAIQETCEKHKVSPIVNLSGHSIDAYDLHSGLTVPNYNNQDKTEFENGVFAIEPFTTFGVGKVHDSKPSEIYSLMELKPLRDNTAREILDYIVENYKTLPFASRWLVKKFGTRALIALRQMKQAGIVHQYDELVESSKNKVAQAEHTILITNKETIVVN